MGCITVDIPLNIDYRLSVNCPAHWRDKSRHKDAIEEMTVISLVAAGVKRGSMRKRLQFTFHWDSGLDLDNHALIRKAIIDAAAGYLNGGQVERDDKAHLGRIVEEFYDSAGSGIGARVEIEERDDLPQPGRRKAHKQSPKSKSKHLAHAGVR